MQSNGQYSDFLFEGLINGLLMSVVGLLIEYMY